MPRLREDFEHNLRITSRSEADSPPIRPGPGSLGPDRYPARVDRPERAARVVSGYRRRNRHGRRQRGHTVSAILVVVGVGLLGGGVYLGTQFALGGSAGRSDTLPPAKASRPPVSGSPATASPAPSASRPAGQVGDYRVAESHYTFTEHPRALGRSRIL